MINILYFGSDKIKKMIRLCVLIICLINIQACAIVSSYDENLNSKNRENIAIPSTWEMIARLTVRYDDEAVNARIKWQQERDKFKSIISSAFGRVLVTIEGNGSEIKAVEDRQSIFDIERIMREDVLISDLRYWLLGQPNPTLPHNYLMINDNQHAFNQNNWQININKFQSYGPHKLPKSIQLTNSQYSLKIFIDNWRL